MTTVSRGAERKVGMSMKAEAVFGAAFIAALAFLAYCIFVLPAKTLHIASLETGAVAAPLTTQLAAKTIASKI
jgi:hypothetical protein